MTPASGGIVECMHAGDVACLSGWPKRLGDIAPGDLPTDGAKEQAESAKPHRPSRPLLRLSGVVLYVYKEVLAAGLAPAAYVLHMKPAQVAPQRRRSKCGSALSKNWCEDPPFFRLDIPAHPWRGPVRKGAPRRANFGPSGPDGCFPTRVHFPDKERG